MSLEFLAGVGFLLFVFLMFTLLAYQKSSQSTELKSYLHAKSICKNFANDINTIAEQGSSYFKYFILPEKIAGNYEYNFSVYANRVEISWDSRQSPYSLPVETQNLTIYCLDKEEGKKNKILNQNERILVTCYRADLKPLAESFAPEEVSAGETINLSIKVKNSGVLSSGDFTVLFNLEPINLSLDPEERKEIKVEYIAPSAVGNYTIPVIVDSGGEVEDGGEVEESIETDNSLNITLEVK